MLDELQRRNYSPSTVRCYIHAVEEFSKHFHRSPERLGPSHIREYQVHLFRDRKLSPGTIQSRCAALRFLFVKTLRRPYLLDEIPLPKRPRKLPAVLNPEEVARLIDSARNLMHRTMLMTLYATGLRRAELCHLKVTDIDSKRMVIHVHQGKGIHQHLDTTLTLMIAGHRVGHYSAEGKLLTLLTKKQINAVKKRLRGKVTEQTFPLNVQIPQTTRDSHVTTASTATNL
jgi:site-specific recombinase XerD